MKKMMIVVCAIALAGMAQAASVGWSLAGCGEYAGDAYSFFVVGQNGVDTVAQITALCADGKDVSSFAFGGGKIAENGSANVSTAASGKSLAGGATYEGFYVVFDNADASKAGNFIAITKDQNAGLVKAITASAGQVTFIGGNQASFVNEPKNWTKAGSGVPEPTSGLLLLMGMAALALKRKVA